MRHDLSVLLGDVAEKLVAFRAWKQGAEDGGG
jgi:hypothetical protein